MRTARRLPLARLDLLEAVAYLAERNEASARRFRMEAEATFRRLAGMPGLGARYDSNRPDLADIRYLPISRFRNWIVFYRPTSEGIEVVRVLHGTRDLGAALSEEFGAFEAGDDPM